MAKLNHHTSFSLRLTPPISKVSFTFNPDITTSRISMVSHLGFSGSCKLKGCIRKFEEMIELGKESASDV